MAEDQVALEGLELAVGDPAGGKLPEAGVDPIDGPALRGKLEQEPPGGQEPLAPKGRQADSSPRLSFSRIAFAAITSGLVTLA